ncbi:hypothetical protein D3C72_1691070 [compost metagenome]
MITELCFVGPSAIIWMSSACFLLVVVRSQFLWLVKNKPTASSIDLGAFFDLGLDCWFSIMLKLDSFCPIGNQLSEFDRYEFAEIRLSISSSVLQLYMDSNKAFNISS